MEFDLSQVVVTHNEAAHRFEATVHGLAALLDYKIHSGAMVIRHTEVPPELGSRGLAGRLTALALDYARSKNLSVVPACSYAVTFMAKHPEYNDLLPPPR